MTSPTKITEAAANYRKAAAAESSLALRRLAALRDNATDAVLDTITEQLRAARLEVDQFESLQEITARNLLARGPRH